MGFYGNITNTSRTTFQFDKVYPSRKAMDSFCNTDGIYNGRFVLVEYDTEISNSEYRKSYYILKNAQNSGHNKVYSSFKSSDISDVNFLDLTQLDARVPKDVLDADTSFIYLEKERVFSNCNDEIKFVVFNKRGDLLENSEDNIAVWHEYWEPTESFNQTNPGFKEAANSLSAAITHFSVFLENEELLNSLGIYFINVVNGIARFQNDIDATPVDPTKPYYCGIVKEGHWYDYNLNGQMWQTVAGDAGIYHEVGENNETLNYRDVQLADSEEDTYTKNFYDDKTYYGTSRGYDSTVWQKVFVNGVEQYVMVAELNTVVPTFGMSTDAPSLLPINPHWGADSTNVYYELHWQPQWGFRVKAANPDLTTPVIDPNTGTILDGIGSINSEYGKVYLRPSDKVVYPSDEDVTWTYHFENNPQQATYYDPTIQSWGLDSASRVPAAIYYNKAGFNPDYIHRSEDLVDPTNREDFRQDIQESHWDATKDYIGFTPTGQSGNLYNRHDGYYGKLPQVDIQEFSIMLPSIGNIISSVWDIVYGGKTLSTHIDGLGYRRNTDISWENGPTPLVRSGIRLRYDYKGQLYNTDAMETLAGCINTTHDLLGMIIVPIEDSEDYRDKVDQETGQIIHPSIPKTIKSDRIYFLEDLNQYCRRTIGYDYVPLEDEQFDWIPAEVDLDLLTDDDISNGAYYVRIRRSKANYPMVIKYISVADLASVFSLENIDPDGFFQGLEANFSYDIETIVTDGNYANQWSTQDVENFFLTYTKAKGQAINVKYYYRTIKELYPEVQEQLVNFPYTIGGKQYNYYRESAYGDISSGVNENAYNYFKADSYEGEAAEQTDFYYVNPGQRKNLDGVYEPNKYYYVDRIQSTQKLVIKKDTAETATEDRTYYYINEEDFLPSNNNIQNDTFGEMYLPGRYYYKVARLPEGDQTKVIGSYLLDWTLDASDIKTYGEIDPNSVVGNSDTAVMVYRKRKSYQTISEEGTVEIYIEVSNYTTVNMGQNGINYLPSTYYEKVSTNPDVYQLCTDANYDSSKTYYQRNISYEKRTNQNTYNIDDVLDRTSYIHLGEMSFYRDDTYFQKTGLNNSEFTSVTVYDLIQQWDDGTYDPSRIYYLEKPETEPGDGVRYTSFNNYVTNHPDVIHVTENFYIPYIYHYKIDDNYIFSQDPDKVAGREYYKITQESLNDYFEENPQINPDINYFQPDSYYYMVNGEYVLINEFDPTFNYGTIYTKEDIYVVSDTTENADSLLPKGMKWNVEALCVPSTITLGRRIEYPILKELPQYALAQSTINGLILQNDKTLSTGNPLIRDLNTVGGALNTVKDIIARFDKIRSRELAIVDDAGRIHSAPIDTTQTITVNNNTVEKSWITTKVVGDLVNPKVIINHKLRQLEQGTVLPTIDMNDPNGDSNTGDAIDSVTINTPNVDEAGHVCSIDEQTIIFPNSFGKVLIEPAGIYTQAANTHDTLTFDSDGKIGLSLLTNQQGYFIPTVVIEHAVPYYSESTTHAGNIATGDRNLTVTSHASSLTPAFGETIKVPYVSIDSTGHVTSLKQDTITLPTMGSIQISKSQITGLQNDLNHLQAGIDDINVLIGNNITYTRNDPNTPEDEERTITVQQLALRVAQLEAVIRSLISVDENSNSLVVLSDDEIDNILDWDDIPALGTIAVTLYQLNSSGTVINNNGNGETHMYRESDWIRRRHFEPWPNSNETPNLYVWNSTDSVWENFVLPVSATADEDDLYIYESLTTPPHQPPFN